MSKKPPVEYIVNGCVELYKRDMEITKKAKTEARKELIKEMARLAHDNGDDLFFAFRALTVKYYL